MESRINKKYLHRQRNKFASRIRLPFYGTLAGLQICLFSFISCGTEAPPMSNAITNRDSLPVMVTYGVSKLISDSGVVQYKVVSEEWRVYDRTNPQRQEFPKGIFLERYDKNFEVMMHVTADTAVCYNQNLWELHGRVYVRNSENGTSFSSDELFWDMNKHWMYSNKPMRLITPDRDLQGNRFESNEQLTKYRVWQTSASAPVPAQSEDTSEERPDSSMVDSTIVVREAPASPKRASKKDTPLSQP